MLSGQSTGAASSDFISPTTGEDFRIGNQWISLEQGHEFWSLLIISHEPGLPRARM